MNQTNTFTISVTNPIPLDIAFSFLNLVNNKKLDFPEINQLKKYIFIKEIEKTKEVNNYNIIDVCLIYFCENNELKENKNLYKAFNCIKDLLISMYGELENYDSDTSYMKILNSECLISNEFDYKKLYSEENTIYLYKNLVKCWNDLEKNIKNKWILFSFVSLDYILLNLIYENFTDDVLQCIENLEKNEFNSIFELMITNYINVLIFEEETVYKNNQAISGIYYLSTQDELDKLIKSKLKNDNLNFYNEVLNLIK